MSLTNSSLPIQTVSNTDSQYYLTVQNFTQGQTNKELVNPALLWQNNKLSINGLGIQVPTTSNVFSTFTTSSTPPRNPVPDDTWYDTLSDIIFRYIDDGTGKFQWVDISSLSNFGDAIPPEVPISVFYFVLGGGGGGGSGNNGNTGGAGGGGGGVLTGSLDLVRSNTFTIVVGGGGTGGTVTSGPTAGNPGAAGTNSTISGPSITTITARGGGGGAGAMINVTPIAQPSGGGSGGGGFGLSTGPTNALAFGSPGYNVSGTQGYPGGSQPNLLGVFPAVLSGGGGAGGTGGNYFGPVAPASGGNGTGAGGVGYLWPYTGVTYGGGGGGGSYQQCKTIYGLGGPGGGGNGGNCQGPPACRRTTGSGTNGLGGGGGGGGLNTCSFANGPGGAGGSGAVILAVPTDKYKYFSAPGATVTTPPAAPGMTVLRYNSPGQTTPGTFTLTLS